MLNKLSETLLSVEHIALFFSDLAPSAIHVIVGGKNKKKIKKRKKGEGKERKEREKNL